MVMSKYANLFYGIDALVPCYQYGQHVEKRYVNFDNGASTPAFKSVMKIINNFMPYYSGVHRGSGFKSQLSTHAFEQSREIILDFVGANPEDHLCIFGKNTTEAINKLAHRFPFTELRDVVLCSMMEHHSNDLPWRHATKVVHIGVHEDGSLDLADLQQKLDEYGSRIALVAVTGASNVTGVINPIHDVAEMVHGIGAKIIVDCAQLIAHRPIDMRPMDDPKHIDFIAFSAHKMYAPFGIGCLVGPKQMFMQGVPDMVGGGTVEIVTLEKILWAPAPDRDEAGSPNVVGVIALAAAIRELQSIGMDNIAEHEDQLVKYALKKLKKIKGIKVYGPASDRLGAIPFGFKNVPYNKVGAILNNEFGIGVRVGCFCAHPYLLKLINESAERAHKASELIKYKNDRSLKPGLVRISFGLYNTTEDIDRLVDALKCITKKQYNGKYRLNKESNEYVMNEWEQSYDKYFKLPDKPNKEADDSSTPNSASTLVDTLTYTESTEDKHSSKVLKLRKARKTKSILDLFKRTNELSQKMEQLDLLPELQEEA